MRNVQFLLFCCSAVLAACEGSSGRSTQPIETSDDDLPEVGPICPSCDPQSGGESSDYGGSQTACSFFVERFDVTEEEAVEHGFDVVGIRDHLERRFQAPLYWVAFDPGASGYEPDTTITGKISVPASTSWQIERLDPRLCSNDRCSSPDFFDGDEFSCGEGGNDSRDTLAGHLWVDVVVEIETADQAVKATLTGSHRSPEWDGQKLGVDVDLAAAQGTLQLQPPFEPPYIGSISSALELGEDDVSGWLRVSTSMTLLDGGDLPRSEYYVPLLGYWPERPAPCGETGQICCELVEPGCSAPNAYCGNDRICAEEVLCGSPGEACCSDGSCEGDGCCVDQICVASGGSCSGSTGSQCIDGSCMSCEGECTCGDLHQECCPVSDGGTDDGCFGEWSCYANVCQND
jgi:hypothetical protein